LRRAAADGRDRMPVLRTRRCDARSLRHSPSHRAPSSCDLHGDLSSGAVQVLCPARYVAWGSAVGGEEGPRQLCPPGAGQRLVDGVHDLELGSARRAIVLQDAKPTRVGELGRAIRLRRRIPAPLGSLMLMKWTDERESRGWPVRSTKCCRSQTMSLWSI